MRIFQATPGDIPRVTPLFVEYRAFYRLPARPEAAEAFLLERCTAGESVLFVAQSEAGEVLGFTHLYPLFCSLALKPVWLLYDLFVAPAARQQGVAQALLARADRHGQETGAAFLMLSTATDRLRPSTKGTATSGTTSSTATSSPSEPLPAPVAGPGPDIIQRVHGEIISIHRMNKGDLGVAFVTSGSQPRAGSARSPAPAAR
ncbi:GNAT family N-acetyltransferase [Aeromonas caviae]|uniref:GNAT family N-acetyltransferase n=1 Tax=Aeromonas caviae TaxID=648 RepID=UPI0029D7893E|nr:GNAT family N-acetyltransferase [Aeromonas caviae]MDX7828735.1 GNAT family N-acetyltransferase [Aeromonas caviae]